MTRAGAIVRGRCPRCREGAVFATRFRMHAACPACGLVFEREPGYFLGAMYFSYALAIAAGCPLVVLLALRDVPLAWIITALVVELVVVAGPLFRTSRVLWLHFDNAFDPR